MPYENEAFIDTDAVAKQLADLKAENQKLRQQMQAQQEAAQVVLQARQLLDAAGLTLEDPRLADVKALGPTQEGLLALSQRVVQLTAAQRDAVKANSSNASVTDKPSIEQFKERWAALRGTGHDSAKYRRFLDDLRAADLTLADVA